MVSVIQNNSVCTSLLILLNKERKSQNVMPTSRRAVGDSPYNEQVVTDGIQKLEKYVIINNHDRILRNIYKTLKPQ